MASVDGDPMDYDHDDSQDESGPASKKAASSSQTRKAQNRLAQREFRLRKQIRDLEARVEIMSGDKEERMDLTLLLVKNLLKENKELRELIKSISSFFGEGLGSCLPRLGLSAPQLDAILNRADTDTAHEAFLALKASKEMEEANPGLPLGEVRRSSTAIGQGSGSVAPGKRKRSSLAFGSETPEVTPASGPSTSHTTQTTGAVKEDDHHRGSNGLTNVNTGAGAGGNDKGFDAANVWDFFFQNAAMCASVSADAYSAEAQAGPSNTGAGVGVGASGPTGGGAGSPSNPSTLTYLSGSAQANNSGFGLTVPPSFTSPSATAPSPASGSASATAPALDPTQGPSGPSSGGCTAVPPPTRTPTTASPRGSGIAPHSYGPSDSPSDEQQRSNLRAKVAQLTGNLTTPVTSMDASAPTLSPAAIAERRRIQEELRQVMHDQGEAEKKTEALQLITYHLNNFRVNHDYMLPPSLRPTPVQRTMPHEHAIDGIIFPGIRDRMILLRGRYDLVDAFQGYIHEFTIHGEDVLDHRSWESSELWLNEFPMLADEEVYTVTNKWRASRNEPPITRAERGERQRKLWSAPDL